MTNTIFHWAAFQFLDRCVIWFSFVDSRHSRTFLRKPEKKVNFVCWDASDIIYIDYLGKGKTITDEYYANLLDRFNDVLKEKR